MTRGLARVAGLAAGLLTALPGILVGQGRTVQVTGPAGDPIHDGTPKFVVTTGGFPADELPLELRVQVALSAGFTAPLLADTAIVATSATVVIPRLLPPNVPIWWRVVVRNAKNVQFISAADGPHLTAQWLSLVFPNNLNGTTVPTKRPTFVWSAPALYPPVAPWRFGIVIARSSDGFVVANGTLPDTAYTPILDLESNTSYRWSVSAVAGTGDSVRVFSGSTFVIASPDAPIATILFQSFPTPFPTARLQATCIWFDLRQASPVALDVLDLRGNHVKRIIPAGDLSGVLPSGRYGRVAPGSDSGCDARLTWDGTDARGRVVPAGVYLIRFSADGVTTTRKVLFKGR